MSSRKQDMLGHLIDTALQQDDDAPDFDNKGYTILFTPEAADVSDDTEDDDAFRALRESGPSPGGSPGDSQLHEATDRSRGRHPGRDAPAGRTHQGGRCRAPAMVAQYRQQGQQRHGSRERRCHLRRKSMNNNEERMERSDLDSDSGWGFHVPGPRSSKRDRPRDCTRRSPSPRRRSASWHASSPAAMPARQRWCATPTPSCGSSMPTGSPSRTRTPAGHCSLAPRMSRLLRSGRPPSSSRTSSPPT